ncbi:MAG: Rieske 2Fe-2S domain-containing protein [Acidimicrobiales bacterium]|jgi:nitrite reductase/ring-hydroxylating ferredoxin subunit|nr:Rieske 2Fe-2S domain-containing protein [Acidimicrobiales bacterium]
MGMTAAEWERIQASGIKGPGRDRYPFPVPNGWFAVAQSDQLKPGDVRNVHYFGTDLVVWREEGTGTPHTVDAYCAHLGAHLGVGSGAPESHEPGPGLVHGACLQCPFHGWRYDGTGRVVDIPYSTSERIPERARVRAYPTVERNGLIFAWHHLLGEPPQWELPVIPEIDDPDWVGPIYTDRYIATAVQELMENDQDTVHFVYVHGAEEIPVQTTRWEGRMRITEAPRENGVFVRESHQLGFVMLRVPGGLVFFSSSSPIDEGHTHQRWVFAYHRSLGEEAGQAMVDAFAKSGIYQDVPIWEHKQYVPHPVLVKDDGEIAEYRRWVRQFYSWPEGADTGSDTDRQA